MGLDHNKCPVCKTQLPKPFDAAIGFVECRRCSNFNIPTSEFGDGATKKIYNELAALKPKERANFSGLIRENQRENEEFWLTIDKIDRFKNHPHPHIFEKADKLLLYFDKNTDYAGRWLDYSKQQDELMGISWAVQSEEAKPYRELSYLLRDYLWATKKFLEVKKEGEAKHNSNPKQFWDLSQFCITPLGHEYIQTLMHANVNSNQGFCAMWFGGEDEKKYSSLWENAIKIAIEAAGYDPIRIDKIEHANDINDEMLRQLRQSKFVICDINEKCCGAYFEAGFAKGLNLPVIWICEKIELDEERLHFDVNHYNFIIWENLNDNKEFMVLVGNGRYEKLSLTLWRRILAILGAGKQPLKDLSKELKNGDNSQ